MPEGRRRWTEGEGSDDERVEDPDIPVEQTRQTVQNDLVQSGLRQPFRERLTLIINEFGTALAGNPENLNAAIRRGAPALDVGPQGDQDPRPARTGSSAT